MINEMEKEEKQKKKRVLQWVGYLCGPLGPIPPGDPLRNWEGRTSGLFHWRLGRCDIYLPTSICPSLVEWVINLPELPPVTPHTQIGHHPRLWKMLESEKLGGEVAFGMRRCQVAPEPPTAAARIPGGLSGGWFGVTVAIVISPSFLLITDITLYIYLFACLFSLLQWKFHKGRGLTFLLSLSVSPVPGKHQAHNRCSINRCGLVDRLTHPTPGPGMMS